MPKPTDIRVLESHVYFLPSSKRVRAVQIRSDGSLQLDGRRGMVALFEALHGVGAQFVSGYVPPPCAKDAARGQQGGPTANPARAIDHDYDFSESVSGNRSH